MRAAAGGKKVSFVLISVRFLIPVRSRSDPPSRRLHGRRRPRQAPVRGRGGPLGGRAGQGRGGRGKVLPLQQIRAAAGRRLQRGSHLSLQSGERRVSVNAFELWSDGLSFFSV